MRELAAGRVQTSNLPFQRDRMHVAAVIRLLAMHRAAIAEEALVYGRFFNHRSAPAPTIQQHAKARTSINPSPAMVDLGSQSGKPDSRTLFLIREVNRRPVARARTNATISAIFKSRFSPTSVIVAKTIM